jgi:hypothetical protein
MTVGKKEGPPRRIKLAIEYKFAGGHPISNSPTSGLSTAERTGSPVLHTLWSYVLDAALGQNI